MWFRYLNLGLILSCWRLDVAFSSKEDLTRKVTVTRNPGCDLKECQNSSTINLIYGRAQGPNDTLHYVISTVGPSSPTILLLRSPDASASLQVNWARFVSNSSHDFAGAVGLVSSLGKSAVADVETVIVLNRVLQYNDSTDTAVYNASTEIQPHISLNRLIWNVTTLENTTQLLGKGVGEVSFSPNSSISMKFTPHGCRGQASILPSLPFNANSSGWEINLDSLLTKQAGSRFAIEALLLGVETNTSKLSTKSIDDEYAPAAFTTDEILWKKSAVSTFHKWRAVGYTTSEHTRSSVTDVKSTSLTALNETSDQVKGIHSNRLLASYFGSEKLAALKVESVIFSFGQPEDGFYVTSNFTSWTSTVGFGDPPTDQFSTLVLCMIFIGIGCPLLVILFGGLYVIYVRIKRSGNAFRAKLLPTNYDYQPIEK